MYEYEVVANPTLADVPTSEFEARAAKLREGMRRRNLDCVFIFGSYSEATYTLYVGNFRPFTTSAAIVLPLEAEPAILSTWGQLENVRNQSWITNIRWVGGLLSDFYGGNTAEAEHATNLAEVLREYRIGRMGLINEGKIPSPVLGRLKAALPGAQFEDASDLLHKIMEIKSPSEIQLLRRAAEIGDHSMELGLALIGRERGRLREIDVWAAAQSDVLQKGAEVMESNYTVAAGPPGIPGRWASTRHFREGDLIRLDFHCRYKGYFNDCGRMVSLGPLPPEHTGIMKAGGDAIQLVMDHIRPGIPAKDVFAKVDDYVRKTRYYTYFQFDGNVAHHIGMSFYGHLGYGGFLLDGATEDLLRPNMVLAARLALWKYEYGPFLIETSVLVTEHGMEPLNKVTVAPMQL